MVKEVSSSSQFWETKGTQNKGTGNCLAFVEDLMVENLRDGIKHQDVCRSGGWMWHRVEGRDPCMQFIAAPSEQQQIYSHGNYIHAFM